MRPFFRAAEGIRTLDLLHGKQNGQRRFRTQSRWKQDIFDWWARSRVPRLLPGNHGGLGTRWAPSYRDRGRRAMLGDHVVIGPGPSADTFVQGCPVQGPRGGPPRASTLDRRGDRIPGGEAKGSSVSAGRRCPPSECFWQRGRTVVVLGSDAAAFPMRDPVRCSTEELGWNADRAQGLRALRARDQLGAAAAQHAKDRDRRARHVALGVERDAAEQAVLHARAP
jgi:hypothetical protein